MVLICLPCFHYFFTLFPCVRKPVTLKVKLLCGYVTNVNISHISIPPSDDDLSTVALFFLATTQNENHPTTDAAIKKSHRKSDFLASVVHKLANAIHWINLCSVDNESGLHNTCPLRSD